MEWLNCGCLERAKQRQQIFCYGYVLPSGSRHLWEAEYNNNLFMCLMVKLPAETTRLLLEPQNYTLHINPLYLKQENEFKKIS